MRALARYAREFYDILATEAKVEEIKGVEVKVFRGSVVKLWNRVGASNSYYTKVMQLLDATGSIRMIQRGAGSSPTVIAVIRKPTPTQLESPTDLTPATESATLALRAEVEGLKANVGGINIAEALRDIEQRVKKLEREVSKNGKKS